MNFNSEIIIKKILLKKRIFDLFISTISLVIFIPLFLLLYLLIFILSGYPVIFKQIRFGQYGKSFTIYKFRTMVVSSDKNLISTSNDKRITKIGKVLRKFKLDEIPEIINIIKGDMSLVGPRPDMPEYLEKINEYDKVILNLKPGLTGPASLKYINEEEILSNVLDPRWYNDNVIFPDKLRINKLYIEQWSFFLDLKIIYHTLIRKPYKESNYFK